MDIDLSKSIVIDNPTEEDIYQLRLLHHNIDQEIKRLQAEIKELHIKKVRVELSKDKDGKYIFALVGGAITFN